MPRTPAVTDSSRTNRTLILGLLGVVLLAVVAAFAFGWVGGGVSTPAGPLADSTEGVQPLRGDLPEQSSDPARDGVAGRSEVEVDPASITGVRGIVLDARTREPLPGVEVIALRVMPNLERPMTRFKSLFQDGLYVDTSRPVKILGSTHTRGDGTFELLGLPKGKVFLDARSERAYVRNPGMVRLARGQIAESVELLASPGGRIVGTVTGPEGKPSANTRVSVRPGLNSFLGQLTQRKYKWLEVMTDENGRYELAGVPTGDGYSVTYASPEMAMEERHGVDIALGQTVTIDVNGKIGGSVTGRAVDAGGAPVAGARVAMVYLDISRMIFSADGRDEAITTDENGYFQLQHVAPGRVAFIAATDAMAPSNIHELAVVDGGVYTDVVLTLDQGRVFTGLVVDGDDRPLPGVAVETRPIDFGDDNESGSDALKMALKIRRLHAKTDASGRFQTAGVAGKRLVMTFTKSGYITVVKSGTKIDVEDFKVQLTRGATVRGRVELADGTPVPRFRVRVKSSLPDPRARDGREESRGVAGPGVRCGCRSGCLREGRVRGERGRGNECRSAARSWPARWPGPVRRPPGSWRTLAWQWLDAPVAGRHLARGLGFPQLLGGGQERGGSLQHPRPSGGRNRSHSAGRGLS